MLQSGTVVADIVFTSATGQDGSTVLVGSTEGSWKVGHAGGQNDFAAVKLDADGGEIWRWQVRLNDRLTFAQWSNLIVPHLENASMVLEETVP